MRQLSSISEEYCVHFTKFSVLISDREKEKGDKEKIGMKKKAKKSDVQGTFQGIKAQKFKKKDNKKSGHKAKSKKPKHIQSSKIGARNRISKKMNMKKKSKPV